MTSQKCIDKEKWSLDNSWKDITGNYILKFQQEWSPYYLCSMKKRNTQPLHWKTFYCRRHLFVKGERDFGMKDLNLSTDHFISQLKWCLFVYLCFMFLFSVLITMKMPLSIIVMSIGLGWFRLPKKKSFCFNKYVKYIIDYPNNIYFAITNKFFIWVKYY